MCDDDCEYAKCKLIEIEQEGMAAPKARVEVIEPGIEFHPVGMELILAFRDLRPITVDCRFNDAKFKAHKDVDYGDSDSENCTCGVEVRRLGSSTRGAKLDAFTCDRCAGDFVAGTARHGCTICDYDICGTCMQDTAMACREQDVADQKYDFVPEAGMDGSSEEAKVTAQEEAVQETVRQNQMRTTRLRGRWQRKKMQRTQGRR